MILIKQRKIFYVFSGLLVTAAVFCIIVFGLKLGIDFTGGSLLEIEYQDQAPSLDDVRSALAGLDLGNISLQKSGPNGLMLKMKNIDESTHQQVLFALEGLGQLNPGAESFESIGPAIGQELKTKTNMVVALCLLCILIYIALAFRKVSRPVKSYIYGLTGLIALCHDVIIPLGIFAVLGRYFSAEINIPIITALLTVFGYSINDTVVVFDRVRENLLKSRVSDFEEIVEQSLRQTMTRSLNTALTTLLALFSMFFLGGVTLRFFSLALILGISFGTYSSIFLATPLVVSYYKLKQKKFK